MGKGGQYVRPPGGGGGNEAKAGKEEGLTFITNRVKSPSIPYQRNLIKYSEMLWRKTRTCSLIPSETVRLHVICREKKNHQKPTNQNPKTNWKHSKCFAENKPTQGLHQPELLKAAGRPNYPNTTEMLNGPIEALRPRQPPGDGQAHTAPPRSPPDTPNFGPCSGTHQPSTAA